MLLLGKPWHYSTETLPAHTFLFSFIQRIVRKLDPSERNWRQGCKGSCWPRGHSCWLSREPAEPLLGLPCCCGVRAPVHWLLLSPQNGAAWRAQLKQLASWGRDDAHRHPHSIVLMKLQVGHHASWTMSKDKTKPPNSWDNFFSPQESKTYIWFLTHGDMWNKPVCLGCFLSLLCFSSKIWREGIPYA